MFELGRRTGGSNGTTRAVAVDELHFGLAEMARGLGYRPLGESGGGDSQNGNGRREMPAHMADIATEMLEKGRELLEPRWSWKEVSVEVDIQRNVLTCKSPFAHELKVGRFIRIQVRGAESVAAFVVTIGSRLETEARALMSQGHPLEGYVLDTVGSVAVEALADTLEKEIAGAAAGQSWKITNRFSPGYCSWETSGQHELFAVFDDQPAGVKLSESSLMSPIKSVSGLIGMGPDVAHKPYPCDFCAMTTCHQRLTQARL